MAGLRGTAWIRQWSGKLAIDLILVSHETAASGRGGKSDRIGKLLSVMLHGQKPSARRSSRRQGSDIPPEGTFPNVWCRR
jgi:hypothetical protein